MQTLKREAAVLAALLAFGIVVLPFAIYAVGVRVIGEYTPDATPLSLPTDLWDALGRGDWAAWLLVASPYLVVQALRLSIGLWRGRKRVTHVTERQHEARNWRV